MANLVDIVVKGSTNRSLTLRMADSSDGTPETGVTSATSGLDVWYRREGAAKVSLTESDLSALTDAHSDGGILHISDGEYRVDFPDAAFATGAQYVDVGWGATGMVGFGGRVRLVDLDDIITAIAALDTGAGAFSVPLTIYESDGTTLIPECDVILTTTNTSPSANIYANAKTNANGVVTFQLDAGTYYIWRQKATFNFTDNPQTLTVDGSGNATVS